jgi:hypothetical protein
VEDEFLERASHALVTQSGTWLIDPVDDPRVDSFDHVAGVLQLLDRHNRDCASIARRLGVQHLVLPTLPITPFVFILVRRNEVALWWAERRLLVCADALGTARYYRAGDERLAVHPLMRLRPPRFDLRPEVILCGHGPGVFEDAEAALGEAIRTSRRRIPRQAVSAVRAWRNRAGSR